MIGKLLFSPKLTYRLLAIIKYTYTKLILLFTFIEYTNCDSIRENKYVPWYLTSLECDVITNAFKPTGQQPTRGLAEFPNNL